MGEPWGAEGARLAFVSTRVWGVGVPGRPTGRLGPISGPEVGGLVKEVVGVVWFVRRRCGCYAS